LVDHTATWEHPQQVLLHGVFEVSQGVLSQYMDVDIVEVPNYSADVIGRHHQYPVMEFGGDVAKSIGHLLFLGL
jgi:hypothetical protein